MDIVSLYFPEHRFMISHKQEGSNASFVGDKAEIKRHVRPNKKQIVTGCF